VRHSVIIGPNVDRCRVRATREERANSGRQVIEPAESLRKHWLLAKKEKVGKKKEGDPPYGKVENAMRPRFPLSHRACYQRKKTTRENPNQKGRAV